MSKYKLGEFNRVAYDHGQSVVQEMRNVTGIKSGDAHFVVVAVYVDGLLQFAGADAAVNIHIDRLAAKQQALHILGRMESHGEIDKQPSASTPPHMRESEATCEKYSSVGNAAKYKEALSQIAYIVGMFDDIDNVRRRVKTVLENLKKQMPYESEVSNETTEA